MRTCLITGATGFLGGAVVERFRTTHAIVALGHRHAGADPLCADLRDAAAFAGVLRSAAPDLVLHLAAYRDPDFCEEHPEEARRLNVEPVRVLAETVPAGTRVVFVSSDYVFDGARPPYVEDAPRHPVNFYGRTKCEAEDLLRGRPRTTIVRVPVLVGAGPTLADSGFVGQILGTLRSGADELLDDVLMRAPVWIRDAADALAFLVQREVDGTVHLSGPEGATRYGWTVRVGAALGLPTGRLRASRTIVPRRAQRPVDARLSTGRWHALGGAPLTGFVEVVRVVLHAVEG